ncbi:MAG TPA: NADH-quinone oxidoreductase subunit H [Phycisphaerae bacterium]|nr:NADH-quinone oxidoreductase subunit H [Phycisphaerae bacterium]
MLNVFIHICFLILLPPLLPGVINRVKAVLAGRKGPPLLQLYFDLARLLRKQMVLSSATTWVFRSGPMLGLVAVLLAGLLIPFGPFAAPISFTGDLILFVALLGLARFFTAAAALDAGSSFEGMGAARELTFACLAEPAVFLALLALARFSGVLSLTNMLLAPLAAGPLAHAAAPLVLVAAGLLIVLLAENCRMPVDDPNTHLELTMIHEVMVLDHSGPLLGVILYGAAVKLFVFSVLIGQVVLPVHTPWPALDWLIFAGRMIALAVVVGVVESVMARLQMRHVPILLTAACLLCGFGFILMLR